MRVAAPGTKQGATLRRPTVERRSTTRAFASLGMGS